MITVVYSLEWSDIDPAGLRFDPAPARAIAEELVLAAVAARNRDRDALGEAIDQALLATYGAWVAGWQWAASEPGCGGPVHAWCCSSHSLLRDDEPDPRASAARVAAAVCEWHAYLVRLADDFAALRAELAGLPLEDLVERAAARLLPDVIDVTRTEDAWYATFARVLGWCLESFGLRGPRVRAAIDEVVRGSFSSWIEPEEPLARDTCTALGLAVGQAARAPDLRPDALASWQQSRAVAFRRAPGRRAIRPVRGDSHRIYIDGRERARDPARADRMLAALTACRASARRGDRLTFERLAAWQTLVLGADEVDFRTTDAHARAGRERYAIDADTRARFEACLAESEPGDETVAVRAARVYLDLCFFHPFADGNARAARLALDHVITRAGLALHAAEPLFVVARAAADARGAWCFAYVIESLLGSPA